MWITFKFSFKPQRINAGTCGSDLDNSTGGNMTSIKIEMVFFILISKVKIYLNATETRSAKRENANYLTFFFHFFFNPFTTAADKFRKKTNSDLCSDDTSCIFYSRLYRISDTINQTIS